MENLPAINVCHDLRHSCLAMHLLEIQLDPRYEVVLKSTLDDLV